MTFDVAGVTLLMKGKSLVATFAKQFGHWMPESNRDTDQFATILLGNAFIAFVFCSILNPFTRHYYPIVNLCCS
jgi:hypothetical protein